MHFFISETRCQTTKLGNLNKSHSLTNYTESRILIVLAAGISIQRKFTSFVIREAQDANKIITNAITFHFCDFSIQNNQKVI